MQLVLSVGYVTCFWIAYCIFRKLKNAFELFVLARLQSNQIDLVDRYGPWAVVTGSTDGIGKAYARELARRGLKIVLISRTPQKLDTVAREIKSDFGVETKTIVADFSKGSSIYAHIDKELEGIQIGILVNNVCGAVDHPQYLADTSFEFLENVLNVNLGPLLHMTRIVLPQMRKRNRGAIVNVSSVCELSPVRYFSTYGATKSFIKSLTIALQEELRKTNVTVQLLSPAFIKTKFVEFSPLVQMHPSVIAPDAETFVSHAVATLGHSKHTTGYWIHGLEYLAVECMSLDVRLLVLGKVADVIKKQYNHKSKERDRIKLN